MHALCRKPEKTLMTAYGLCQQMMHVFHQFRLYVTFEVMEPAWIGMQTSLDKAHTLDEVSLFSIDYSTDKQSKYSIIISTRTSQVESIV